MTTLTSSNRAPKLYPGMARPRIMRRRKAPVFRDPGGRANVALTDSQAKEAHALIVVDPFISALSLSSILKDKFPNQHAVSPRRLREFKGSHFLKVILTRICPLIPSNCMTRFRAAHRYLAADQDLWLCLDEKNFPADSTSFKCKAEGVCFGVVWASKLNDWLAISHFSYLFDVHATNSFIHRSTCLCRR